MAGNHRRLVRMSSIVSTISETHLFNKVELIFLNTSDIYLGEILHQTYSKVASMPGQAKKTVREGDILLSEIRPANGRWAMVGKDAEDYVVSTKLMVLRPNLDRAHPDFVYIFLTSKETTRKLQHVAEYRSATFPQITFDQVAEIELNLPPMSEQKSIVGIIKSIDEKIKANSKHASILEEIAQTIFKSWFIDFDPVKAKVAGEKPVGMDEATAALFPDSMEDSEVGQIPTGWSVEDFGAVNNLLMGQSPPGDTYNSIGEGLPFYQGRTDFGLRFPKQRVFCTAGTRIAKAGEVLISVRAPVGDLNQAIEDCVIGRGVASSIHKSGSQAYSYALLCSLKPRLAYYNGEGTVFGAINRTDFNSLKVVEPPQQIVDSFETTAGPFNDEIRNLFIQTASLIELRDSLLPRLISSELRIPEELLVA